jgi:hypothetical protein
MLSRSSHSQIGSKASSTTWVPLKALPDVEIIEIEPILAEFLHGQRLSSPSVRNSRFAQGIQACGSVNGKSRPNFTS